MTELFEWQHVHQTATMWLSSDSLLASAILHRCLLLIVQEVCLNSDDDCVLYLMQYLYDPGILPSSAN